MLEEKDLQKYDRQLQSGFAQLKFEPELEAEFRNFFYVRSVVKQRGAILVGIFLLLTLVPLDLRFLEGEAHAFYLLSRIYIPLPVLVIAFIGTFFTQFQRFFSLASFFIITFLGVTTDIFIVYTIQQGQYTTYEGLILIIIVAFFLGGMRFRQSLTCVLIIGLVYLLLSEQYLPADPFQFHHYYFLFAAGLIGGVSAYTLEYQVRLSFLQRNALRNLAKTDPLTQLYNRGAANDKLQRLVDYAYRERKPLTLLLIDVDYFKFYNDSYGHMEGDACLQAVAAALATSSQRPLDFVARFGGEEFLILWFDAPANEAEQLARRLKESIDRLQIPHRQSQVAATVSISGGMVTGIPTDAKQAPALLQQADQCLYRAKDSGRNRIIIQDIGAENSLLAVVK